MSARRSRLVLRAAVAVEGQLIYKVHLKFRIVKHLVFSLALQPHFFISIMRSVSEAPEAVRFRRFPVIVTGAGEIVKQSFPFLKINLISDGEFHKTD